MRNLNKMIPRNSKLVDPENNLLKILKFYEKYNEFAVYDNSRKYIIIQKNFDERFSIEK